MRQTARGTTYRIVILLLLLLIVWVRGNNMPYRKISLNGSWELQPGKTPPTVFEHKIPVPGLVDLAKPEIKWKKFKYFWYRFCFHSDSLPKGRHVYLQLEQVKYGTEVRLNGQHIGGDTPCYTSQEFDLTPFLRPKADNCLLIRVGAKSTLPSGNIAGNDYEKISFIPGIWGDTWLHFYGTARFKWIGIIPDPLREQISVRAEIQNFSRQPRHVRIRYEIREKSNGRIAAEPYVFNLELPGERTLTITHTLKIPGAKLWSPESPFLYRLEATLFDSEGISHHQKTAFGMRRFEIRQGRFYLNGRRRVLFGSNIAFHRMLSDETRGLLPWQPSWIKKVLADIPRAHNLFFFRMHLGHAYNRWYDIADAHGIMLQDEWMAWNLEGDPAQFRREYTAWIKENFNHPSIVIWDALNESENPVVVREIIPALKQLDPTRPWEYADFPEDHPYIYSLGPVLTRRKFGFSRSVFDLAHSPTPTMVNEYIWWWLDQDGNPTPLTQIVLERWLGPHPGKEKILAHQAFLARELGELWRRLDVDAMLPFVYLSLRGGATANWFFGDLSDLRPKPILSALKSTFNPLGISLELWDRHFVTGEKRSIPLYLFNDTPKTRRLYCQLQLTGNKQILWQTKITLPPDTHRVLTVPVPFPQQPRQDTLLAVLSDENSVFLADSRKPVFIFSPVSPPEHLPSLAVHPLAKEARTLLDRAGICYALFPDIRPDTKVVYLNASGLCELNSRSRSTLTAFVRRGGVLILQEPEQGVRGEKELPVLKDLSLFIRLRPDTERGGYDSYVFIKRVRRMLWQGIEESHLQLFNGGLGGEIVSRHEVRPSLPFETVAHCHLSLRVPAVMEIPYGKGWIIISRIQTRGRLLRRAHSRALYARRYDPVAERYFWNLLKAYAHADALQKRVKKKLQARPVFIARARASSGEIEAALDGKLTTRWSSEAKDPQWIWLDFGRRTVLHEMVIRWETAYGKEYKIFLSDDNTHWHLIHQEANSDGKIDRICLQSSHARYLKIECIRRATQWGYSIWEMTVR